jgi:hypothetical protein
VHEVPAAEAVEHPVQTDPTIANAGLTEIDEPVAAVLTNGHESTYETQGIPQNSGFGDGAANAAAEANWDNSNDLSTSQEWVEVPRDATETDTGVTATPVAPSNVQSWADDQPDSPVEVRFSLFHLSLNTVLLCRANSFSHRRLLLQQMMASKKSSETVEDEETSVEVVVAAMDFNVAVVDSGAMATVDEAEVEVEVPEEAAAQTSPK